MKWTNKVKAKLLNWMGHDGLPHEKGQRNKYPVRRWVRREVDKDTKEVYDDVHQGCYCNECLAIEDY